MLHQCRNQQAADAAVAVQEGVDGLELGVHQRHPHQRRKLWLSLVDEVLEMAQQLRDMLWGRRHEHRVAWPRAADPVLRAAQLAGLFARATGTGQQQAVGIAEKTHRERQAARLMQVLADKTKGTQEVADLLHIVGVGNSQARFVIEQVRQRGLRAFDLRGEQRFLADGAVHSHSTEGTRPDTPDSRASASSALRVPAAGTRSAELALARLSGVSGLVPSVEWLVYGAIRKEALLTSQIEGTQATLTDLFDDEAGLAVANTDDVEEVSNYLRAFRLVRENLHKPRGLPLSVRLLCNAHRLLLAGARGAGKQPGELRRSQNWIGGTRPGNAVFVPPPPEHVAELLGHLEHFIHEAEPKLPPLVRVALVHAQFETIHPSWTATAASAAC